MIRIRAASRLHFGLFSLPSEQAGPWLNQEGQPTILRRQFGGVGLMIEQPGIELTLEQAGRWSTEGPLAERALHFAQSYCAAASIEECFAIRMEQAAPEHSGLGVGTQLGLAVARAIAELTRQTARDAGTLATMVGRGRRSALGVHGFAQGGFLVEGGKTTDSAIAPLLVHRAFPDDWRIMLVRPQDVVGIHGRREAAAFAGLVERPPDDQTTETLCRLVLLSMLPALAERDLSTFGEALYDFNRRSGALFKAAQGGTYAHPRVEQIVKAIRGLGVVGVGQSSWGPTVFAVVAGDEAALTRGRLVRLGIEAEEMWIASACQDGAEVTGNA
jgi:beta-ribofuranosylaminobenzene 5'-phosphate synthase